MFISYDQFVPNWSLKIRQVDRKPKAKASQWAEPPWLVQPSSQWRWYDTFAPLKKPIFFIHMNDMKAYKGLGTNYDSIQYFTHEKPWCSQSFVFFLVVNHSRSPLALAPPHPSRDDDSVDLLPGSALFLLEIKISEARDQWRDFLPPSGERKG